MWISLLIVLLGQVFGLEVGKVEVREQDVMIHIRGAERITLEVLNPPKGKKSGPNIGGGGLSKIFRYVYAVPCYGYAYYKDSSKDVVAAIPVRDDLWIVETERLPMKGNFYLLPVRICPCFSDTELKVIDFWNKPLEVACADSSLIWINYTHKEALKELGFEGDIVFKVRIKDEKGKAKVLEFRIPNR